MVWSATYSTFGEAYVDPSPTIENNLRSPGQYFDKDTALHYNRYRYYDPSSGRYLRIDPIGLSGGNNRYAYAKLNPIVYIDPLGLKEYITISGALTVNSPWYVGGEAGVFFVIDPCEKVIHGYNYKAIGFGAGKGAAVTIEVGGLWMENLDDITGYGWAISGFATKKGFGGSLQLYGNFNFLSPWHDKDAIGVSGGIAIGGGGGASALLTHTRYVGEIDINELPPETREAVEKILVTIEEIYEDYCKRLECEKQGLQTGGGS